MGGRSRGDVGTDMDMKLFGLAWFSDCGIIQQHCVRFRSWTNRLHA
jgi:hypothetical protein